MEYVKEDLLLGNKKIIVGDKLHDLVLENLGRIYIRYGNSYKEFNSIINSLSKATTSGSSSIVLIEDDGVKSGSEYKSGKLVFDGKDQILYLAYEGELLTLAEYSEANSPQYVKKSGDTMNGQLIINTLNSPLVVVSSELVNNLNANYLEGKDSNDFAQKEKDETITGNWTLEGQNTFTDENTFKEKTTFEQTAKFEGSTAIRVDKGSIITDGSMGSSVFQSGYNGTGWMLDANTNTLTIDNLIVRGVLNVFELVVNKISATNGSFWVTDSFKIKEVKDPIYINVEDTETFIDWTIDDYYIPYSPIDKYVEYSSTKNDFSSSNNIQKVFLHSNQLNSRSSLGTETTFIKYKFMFKIKDLNLFNNMITSDGSIADLPNEEFINYLVENDAIEKINIFQDSSSNEEFFTKETNEDGTTFDSLKESIPAYDYKFDIQEWETIPTDYVKSDKSYNNTNLCKLNLYYKYFGSTTIDSKLYILKAEEKEYPVFKSGDILRCLKFTGKGVKQYHAIVCGIVDDYSFLVQLQHTDILSQKVEYEYDEDGNLISNSVTEDNTIYQGSSDETKSGVPQNDDALVRIGSIFSGDRQNSLYLTSSEGYSPFMDVIVGINRPDYTVSYYIPDYEKDDILYSKLSLNIRVRVGNLSGIYDEKLKNKQPTGYGLYGENVYLTGNFYLNNGTSLLDVSNQITAAVGNLDGLEERLDTLEQNQLDEDDLKSAVNSYISANQSSIMKLGLDYNIFALGSAGMTIINPDVKYDSDGNIDESTVGNGDEYIEFLADKLEINNYQKSGNSFVILGTLTNPNDWKYVDIESEENTPYSELNIVGTVDDYHGNDLEFTYSNNIFTVFFNGSIDDTIENIDISEIKVGNDIAGNLTDYNILTVSYGTKVSFKKLTLSSLSGTSVSNPKQRLVNYNDQLYSFINCKYTSVIEKLYYVTSSGNLYELNYDDGTYVDDGWYFELSDLNYAYISLSYYSNKTEKPTKDYLLEYSNARGVDVYDDTGADGTKVYSESGTITSVSSNYYYVPLITQAALFTEGKINADFIDAEKITTRNLIATQTDNYTSDGDVADESKPFVRISGTTGILEANDAKLKGDLLVGGDSTSHIELLSFSSDATKNPEINIYGSDNTTNISTQVSGNYKEDPLSDFSGTAFSTINIPSTTYSETWEITSDPSKAVGGVVPYYGEKTTSVSLQNITNGSFTIDNTFNVNININFSRFGDYQNTWNLYLYKGSTLVGSHTYSYDLDAANSGVLLKIGSWNQNYLLDSGTYTLKIEGSTSWSRAEGTGSTTKSLTISGKISAVQNVYLTKIFENGILLGFDSNNYLAVYRDLNNGVNRFTFDVNSGKRRIVILNGNIYQYIGSSTGTKIYCLENSPILLYYGKITITSSNIEKTVIKKINDFGDFSIARNGTDGGNYTFTMPSTFMTNIDAIYPNTSSGAKTYNIVVTTVPCGSTGKMDVVNNSSYSYANNLFYVYTYRSENSVNIEKGDITRQDGIPFLLKIELVIL